MKVLSPLKGRDDEEDDTSTSGPCEECGWEVGHSWTCSRGGNQP